MLHFISSKRRDKKLLAKTSLFKNTSKLREEAEKGSNFGLEVTKEKAGKTGQKKGEHSRGKEDFEKMRGKTKPSKVMFVRWTQRGRLAGKLKEQEDLTGFRISFMEEEEALSN